MFSAVPALGQETNIPALPFSGLTGEVDEIVVTATRTPLMLKNTPVITRVITAREIENRGAATIQEVLEGELAGVEFHQAGYGSSLSFQGLDARYVLFLVDGERMAGETYGNIDYSRIPLANIERIEIVRGASSVLYGSNAMGAVVNIITKMPQKKVEINASVLYGTRFQKNSGETLGDNATEHDLDTYRSKLDLPNLKADLSLGLNFGKFRSLTMASYRAVDAVRLVGTMDETRNYAKGELKRMGPKMIPIIGPGGQIIGMRPEIDPETGIPVFEVKSTNLNDTTVIVGPDQRGLSISGWRDFNIAQRFDYELNEKFRFQLSGSYFNKQRYDFNQSITDDNPLSAIITKPWTYETYSGYDVKALMEHSPNENNKIYLSFVRDEYFRNLDSLSGVSTHKQRHAYTTPRLLWTLDAGQYNRLTTGIELLNEQLRFDLNASEQKFDDLKSMNTVSAYVQDEILSGKPLSFTAGIRADYNNRFGWGVTPKASVKYTYKNFTLRGNYSNGYRTPSLKEMYMSFRIPIPGTITIIEGNDKLRPERNNYLSLSAEYTNPTVNLSVTAYNSFFRNKIDVRGEMDGDNVILKYQNIDKSQLGGIEVMARVRLARSLFVKANYNYIYQADDAPEESTQYIFPSPHTATFRVDYGFKLWGGYVGVMGLVRYAGPKNYEDFMPILEGTMPNMTKYWTGNYSARHDGYAVCDLAVSAEIKRMLTLTLGVDNIFNYQAGVINFNSAVVMPRNFFVRLAYYFGVN